MERIIIAQGEGLFDRAAAALRVVSRGERAQTTERLTRQIHFARAGVGQRGPVRHEREERPQAAGRHQTIRRDERRRRERIISVVGKLVGHRLRPAGQHLRIRDLGQNPDH